MHKQFVCKIIITSKELFECPDFVISDPGGNWTLKSADCYLIKSNRTCIIEHANGNIEATSCTTFVSCGNLHAID